MEADCIMVIEQIYFAHQGYFLTSRYGKREDIIDYSIRPDRVTTGIPTEKGPKIRTYPTVVSPFE